MFECWGGEVPGSWHACVDTWTSLTSHFLLNFSFNFQCLGFVHRWPWEQWGQQHIRLTWTCIWGPNGEAYSRRWPAGSHLYKIVQVSLLKESWWVFFRRYGQPQNEQRSGASASEEVLGATGDLETLALHGEAKHCINNTQCLKIRSCAYVPGKCEDILQTLGGAKSCISQYSTLIA